MPSPAILKFVAKFGDGVNRRQSCSRNFSSWDCHRRARPTRWLGVGRWKRFENRIEPRDPQGHC